MLNPHLITCQGSDAAIGTASANLDTAVSAAVVAAKAVPGVLLNQITIVPGSNYQDSNSLYVFTASVVYSVQ